MKKSIILLVFFHFLANGALLAQGEAEQLFKTKCGICHTVGKGKLVGPDLAGAHERHPHEWLLNFIRSSQKMVTGGDSAAVALFEQNNKVVMPDPYRGVYKGYDTGAQYARHVQEAIQRIQASGRGVCEAR